MIEIVRRIIAAIAIRDVFNIGVALLQPDPPMPFY
jgi:hypothetical protein